jgi:Na+-translocating ferredoxin:NAD+ oxidoreductase subunit C
VDRAGFMGRTREFKRGGVAMVQRIAYKSKPIENAFLPMNAVVMLKTAKEFKESIPVVSVGQEVREGQLIARSGGKGSSHCHSPIPGIIRRIDRTRAPGGYDSAVIVISLEGSFSVLGKKPERYLWKSLSKADISHIIQDKGIVRVLDGEPLHESLAECSAKHGCAMVVNALEMDPYRRTEEELLTFRPEDVIDGCAIAARVSSPSSIIVAIDETASATMVSRLQSVIASSGMEVGVQLFSRRFPQDMPSQIANALDLDAGVIPFIIEPSTLIALHDAVVSNKPHIEQYVHVGGGAIKHPAILKARIGAPVGDLVEECGGFIGKPEAIVIGGPFRGRVAVDLDTPITRTTRAILALTSEETRSAPERACVRCGACVMACPEGLDPHRLHKLIRADRIAEAKADGLDRCSSCGACAYVCRSRIPLVQVLDAARETGKVR